MDASHFDAHGVRGGQHLRLDDLRPHIYRTRDGGKTWTHITNGIPDGGIINVVREDPKRRGLLFAGTEQQCTSRSTTARTGSRCGSTCRRRRSATWSSRTTTSSSARTAGRSGSSTTSRRCGRSGPRRRRGRAPLPAAAGVALSLEQEHGHAAAARRARRSEPAGRRDHQLLAEAGRTRRRSRSRLSTRAVRRAHVLERRRAGAADRGPRCRILDSSDADAVGTPGFHRFVWDVHYAPPAVAAFSYPIAAIHAQHAAGAARSVGAARPLHGAPHRGRQDVHAPLTSRWTRA